LFAATQAPADLALLIVVGCLSVLLGLVVLFNLRLAVPSLLGLLLGIQILLEGVTLLVPGRLRPRGAAAA
jgi:uncharacterized membrane protein HdeD (DUF308 family)